MKKRGGLKVEVDRVEGDMAVLVVADDEAHQFNLPARHLPEGVKGGDHLTLTFKVDRESQEKVKQEVDDLLKQLTGGGKQG